MSKPGWRRSAAQHRRRHREVEEPPRRSKVFADSDELCHWALQMFTARNFLALLDRDLEVSDEERAEGKRLAQTWRRRFHDSCTRSGHKLPLCQAMCELDLSPMEREILTALVLSDLGLIEGIDRIREMMIFLNLPDRDAVCLLRDMDQESTLCRAGLLYVEDDLGERARRRIMVDPTLSDNVLRDERDGLDKIDSPQALLAEVGRLSFLFARKRQELEMQRLRPMGGNDGFRLERHILRKLRRIFAVLQRHPDWGLHRLLESRTSHEYRALLILLAKSQGQLRPGHPLFRGKGLAMACLDPKDQDRLPQLLEELGAEGSLQRQGLIRPSPGAGHHADDDGLEAVELELTTKALDMLGCEDRTRGKRRKQQGLREPRLRLDQLVLSPEIREALELALGQARDAEVLLEDWGMGELLPYGRSLSMLFYGPPGTGKTAAAEALARELGRPFLPVDYSQMQNSYVGQTEKNICETFALAQREGALLFFDEADAVFATRDMAQRAWELSHANTLLRELERFEGTCVLATNRAGQLDAALERRIQIKLHFDRPDPEAREAIWRILLPDGLPLAPNVDPARLARFELSGGEIKNVVLNAAREALQRAEHHAQARIRQEDLERWAHKELDNGWSRKDKAGPIGFGSSLDS